MYFDYSKEGRKKDVISSLRILNLAFT